MGVGRRSVLLSVLATPAFAQQPRRSSKPAPLTGKLEALPQPLKRDVPAIVQRGDLAPVPNRTYEGPVVAPSAEGPTLEPSIIQRRLPGRGEVTEGAPNRREEVLFEPAPGARLTVPFKY